MKSPIILEDFQLEVTPGEIGIEIEMEGRQLARRMDNIYWNVHADGSLRGEAQEYSLKKPINRKQVEEALIILQTELKVKQCKLDASERCGVHVHINVQKNTFDEVLRIIFLSLLMENVLTKYSGESRQGNIFCLRSSDALGLVMGILDSVKSGSFRNLQADIYRYSFINPCALGKFGSLEFRSFRGTNNFEEIIPWVNILLELKDSAINNFSSCEDILLSFTNKGYREFIRNVFPKTNDLLLRTNPTEEMFFDSVNCIQAIPYRRKEILDAKKKIKKKIPTKKKKIEERVPLRRRLIRNNDVW